MIPDDLARLARIQRDAYDLEGRGDEAAASEYIALQAEMLAEHGSTAFGRDFEAIRSELRDRSSRLPSTAWRSAYRASTFVG